MKEIIINRDNLTEDDITEVVTRVKILLVNSSNEILLGYSHNDYQFPGGHVEDGEDLIETINREIEEEVGLKLNLTEASPFAVSKGYWKDHPEPLKNRKTEIYFYEIKTDLKPNLENTSYTDHELEGGFSLRYVSLDNIEDVLLENASLYGDKYGIAREMLEVLKVYKSDYQYVKKN